MLIQGLLQPDPSKRIDWLELCLHPFWDGELTHLADTVDSDLTERSMVSDSLRYTSAVSKHSNSDILIEGCNENISEPDTMNGSTKNSDSIKGRPDTVPQRNTSRALHTTSLNILDENPSVACIPALKPQIDTKEAWHGTYKLERGLAVMDLTDITEMPDDQSVVEDKTAYSKSRESKSPVCHHKSEHITNGSMNSVNVGGLSELVWNFEASSVNITEHLYHATDLQVNPIAENPKLMKFHVLKWDTNLLGFHALNIEKLRNSSKEETKTHVATVFNSYSQVRKSNLDKNGTRQKMHILAYLSSICKYEEVSNIVLNQNHIKQLTNEFKVSGQLDLKIRLGRSSFYTFVVACTHARVIIVKWEQTYNPYILLTIR